MISVLHLNTHVVLHTLGYSYPQILTDFTLLALIVDPQLMQAKLTKIHLS